MYKIFSENPDPRQFVKYYLENSFFLKKIDTVRNGIFSENSLRKLSANEISSLVKQNNLSSNWDDILVTYDFIPKNINNSQFLGKAVIGRLDGTVIVDGKEMVSKILNSTLYNVQIGNNVLVQNVQMLSDVAMLDNSVILNCLTVSHGSDLHFGIGKELSLAIETGGREVKVFPEINIDVARIICRDRDDSKLLLEYEKLVDEYAALSVSKWSVLAEHAQIIDSPKVNNFFMGEYSIVDNACSVKNCVMISEKGEPCKISDGAIVKDCTMQWGAEITTGAITEGSIFTEHSHAERHGKVFDSLIGSNTGIAEGEVTASLVGSFVGFHHQALLISAFWPGGKGNIAYGANVGSNHTGKEPDQELWPGEGMFFGLDCSIKYPSDFSASPYTILATGLTALPQKVTFPFSLLSPPSKSFENISPAYNEIMPAWVLSDNIFMIKRNEGKYKNRNKAKRIYIKFEIFRPSIINKMITALSLLKSVSNKEMYLEKDIPGIGKNYLTEFSRVKAIKTYEKFLAYYCLKELFKNIERENVLLKDLNKILEDSNDDATWEHSRVLFKELDIAKGLSEAAKLLIEMNSDIASQVLKSKQKDDVRGAKITRGYAKAHVSAEKNTFVVETLKECEIENKKLTEFI